MNETPPPPEMPCSCANPGFCPRFNMEQQNYPWQICQGNYGEEKGLAYRKRWTYQLTGQPKVGELHQVRVDNTPAVHQPKARKEPKKGFEVIVKKQGCGRKCKWAWVVKLDGVLKEHGECDTEEEARKVSEKEAVELAEFLGVPYPSQQVGMSL